MKKSLIAVFALLLAAPLAQAEKSYNISCLVSFREGSAVRAKLLHLRMGYGEAKGVGTKIGSGKIKFMIWGTDSAPAIRQELSLDGYGTNSGGFLSEGGMPASLSHENSERQLSSSCFTPDMAHSSIVDYARNTYENLKEEVLEGK